MGKLWTKDEERNQLQKIKALIEETEYGSYIRMAFCGCVKLAEENIEYDMGNSYPEMLEHKDKQIAEYGAKLLRLEHERDALQKNLDNATEELTMWKNKWSDTEEALRKHKEEADLALTTQYRKSAEELANVRDERDAMADSVEGLTEICDKAEAEIMRLKAEIYDLRKECGK